MIQVIDPDVIFNHMSALDLGLGLLVPPSLTIRMKVSTNIRWVVYPRSPVSPAHIIG